MARPPASTPRSTDATISEATLTAGARLTPPPKPRSWRPYAWAAALLLHAAVIALFFIVVKAPKPPEAQSPPGVSVVFDNGGTTQTTAPAAPRTGPTTLAQAPTPSAPPPPAQVAQDQPEVNLNLPNTPLAALPQPTPQPHPQAKPTHRPTPTHRPAPKYLVMNNMSFNHPTPPTPFKNGMNLDLPQSDAQAATAPEVSIKGDVGADWNAELDQWVDEHKYYPDSAAEQGQQGSVEIRFTVDRNGNVTGLHLVSSSGSPFLDQAWLGLFAENQLPPFPPGTKANTADIDATMHFELIP